MLDILTQKYESLKYKTQENMNNDIELLKREVERKNNELVDYLNSLKMDLKNYKQVKFNEQMKNMNNNNEFVKDNYDNFNLNNDPYTNRNRRRRTNQYDYNDNNHNYNFNNINEENNNFQNFNENENNYRNNNYNNNNNLYANKAPDKRSVNLRSSSRMIFNREEYFNERNNNNTSINESKITKFGSIGKNLIADSEFIPINESIFNNLLLIYF